MKKTFFILSFVFSILLTTTTGLACNQDYIKVTGKLGFFDAPHGNKVTTLTANTVLTFEPDTSGEGGMGWHRVKDIATSRVGWVNVNYIDDIEWICPTKDVDSELSFDSDLVQ